MFDKKPAPMTARDRYFDLVGIARTTKASAKLDQQRAALDRAYELRSFEIGLVWTRATYFFTSQAAIFAAFALLFKETGLGALLISFLLALLGLATAWFSYLSARGSRFWQQNWEHHIDLLEHELEGDLHKTVLKKHRQAGFSVSRSQIMLTFAQVCFWVIVVLIMPYRAVEQLLPRASLYVFWCSVGGTSLALFLAVAGGFLLSRKKLGSNIVGDTSAFGDTLSWEKVGDRRRYDVVRRESAAGWPPVVSGG